MAIEVKNISYTYPGSTVTAVENVSMNIEKGERVAIIGQNGAGKSTTVKLMNNIYKPTSGEIIIDGINTKDQTTAQTAPQQGMPMQNMGMPYGYGMPMQGMPMQGMPMQGMPMAGYAPAQDVNVSPAAFQPFSTDVNPLTQKENIELIKDVPLEVTVELGRTTKSIKDILEFAPGTIVELNKIAGESVDVLVNGKYVAKGEVVVIEESFGVRITEIIK